ncbi:hypothetical protein Tco_0451163 [Tanacetum coccineum]
MLKHAVAIASAQNNKGSLEAESIVRAASTRVQFRLSTTPFCSGVQGKRICILKNDQSIDSMHWERTNCLKNVSFYGITFSPAKYVKGYLAEYALVDPRIRWYLRVIAITLKSYVVVLNVTPNADVDSFKRSGTPNTFDVRTSKDNEDPRWSISYKTKRTQKTSALEVL